MADSAAPGAVTRGVNADERMGDGGRTAVEIVSELAGAGTEGAAVVAWAACDTTAAAGLLSSTGLFGPAAAC
jgi:hypothetical protein